MNGCPGVGETDQRRDIVCYLVGSGFEFLAGDFGDLISYFDIKSFLRIDSLSSLTSSSGEDGTVPTAVPP